MLKREQLHTLQFKPLLVRHIKRHLSLHAITTDEEISAGQLLLNIRFANVIPVAKRAFNLCDILDESGADCPVGPGEQTLKFSMFIPSAIPSVSLNPLQ